MHRLTVALSLALLGTGCSTITPASFGGEAPRLSVPWPGPIAVSVAPRENPGSRFNANGIAFEANLDEFSAHLAGLVTGCLRESGVAVGPGGHSLEVQVVYLDFMFQGPCYVDYTVTLGSGQRIGLQSTGESRNFKTACRKAFEAAVPQLLRDARTTGYLGAR